MRFACTAPFVDFLGTISSSCGSLAWKIQADVSLRIGLCCWAEDQWLVSNFCCTTPLFPDRRAGLLDPIQSVGLMHGCLKVAYVECRLRTPSLRIITEPQGFVMTELWLPIVSYVVDSVYGNCFLRLFQSVFGLIYRFQRSVCVNREIGWVGNCCLSTQRFDKLLAVLNCPARSALTLHKL